MTTQTSRIAFCLGLLAACALGSAQQPAVTADASRPGNSAGSAAAVLRDAHGAFWRDGVLHGAGSDYKVRFDGDGFTFTPALGRRAAVNYPLHLILESIRRGRGAVWSADASAAVRPRLLDRTAIYDRAADIAERIEVRPEGVELSYLFDRPVGGTGDLVVRLAVNTELPARGSSAGGIAFVDDRLGGVRVGGVTGIDALGRRAAGSVRLAGDRHLELVLPAAFVDNAAYPLVLDPRIGADLKVSGAATDDADPDVAYDVSKNVYLVVWQREFSTANIDIYAQRVSTSGALVGSVIAVTSLVSEIAMRPTVGNVNASDRFLVAWQQGPSVFGPWDIVAACVNAADGSVSAPTPIAGGALVNETDPDAASEASLTDEQALVVWNEDDSTIQVAPVSCPAGTGAPRVGSAVLVSGLLTATDPAISKTTARSGRHLITWLGSWDNVHAVCVDRDGNMVSPHQSIRGVGVRVFNADVDGDGTDFLVAWAEEESAGSADRDIWCTSVSFTGSILTHGPPAAIPGGSDANDDEIRPAVGFLWSKFLVTWADQNLTIDYDISALAMSKKGCRPCGQRFNFGGSFTHSVDIGPQIGSRASGGSVSDECLIVWMDAEQAPPYRSEVWAQRFEALGTGGTIVSAGGGCGPAGVAGNNGPFAVGNRNFLFTLTGADPGAAGAIYVLGSPAGPPLVCGGCAITHPLIQLPVPISSGVAKILVPVPCNPALVGGTVRMQWWVAGTSASPCVLAPTVAFSDRIDLTVGL